MREERYMRDDIYDNRGNSRDSFDRDERRRRYSAADRRDYYDDELDGPVYGSRYDPDRTYRDQYDSDIDDRDRRPENSVSRRGDMRDSQRDNERPRSRQRARRETEPAERLASAPSSQSRNASQPSRKSAKPKEKKPRKPFHDYAVVKFLCDRRFHAVLGVALVFVAVYMAVASISFLRTGAEDQSAVTSQTIGEMAAAGDVHNAAGPVGARLAHTVIVEGFGLGSVALLVYLVLLGLGLMGLRKISFWSLTFKTLLVGITTSLALGLVSLWLGTDYNLGGYHGQYVNQWLVANTDWVGAALVSALAIVAVCYVFINDIYRLISRWRSMRRAYLQKLEQSRYEHEQDRIRVREAMNAADRREAAQDETAAAHADDEPEEPRVPVTVGFDDSVPAAEDPYAIADHARYLPPEPPAGQPSHQPEERPSHQPEQQPHSQVSAEIVAETSPEEIEVVTQQIETADEGRTELYDPTAELSHYMKPSVDLLRDIPQKENIVDIDEQEENQARIRKTLNDYGIEISKIKATVGPTVTLYEIIPAEGVRIAKIRNLGDDIALSLSALGIRIIAPMPGKGTIGIEVPNKDPQTVSIRSILSSKRFIEGKEQLPMAMGATISNEVFVADLAKMPHLLVAGATGMGKSVGLNAIIASLLYKRHPAELKFVLVDPKMVEFSLYSVLERHFLAKLPDEEEAVVTQMDKVLPTLISLCTEMDNRLALLRDAGVRNIAEYNEKFVQKRLMPDRGHHFMPYIVLIIDEFADLLMVAGKEIEKPVARIAQKARAVGIHMIVATQRPSTDVITGMIKNNFPGRIAFRVTSMVDSRTILDTPGANQLIGRGDMLFMHNGNLTRVQCAFIDTPEVEAICHHIESQAGYPTAYILPEPTMENEGSGSMGLGAGAGTLGDRDVLFNEVAEAVVNSGIGSTTAVQRRFGIGFARAGKIMDQLEAVGIVGPAPVSGGKPRQVLVDMIGLQDILHSL